MPNTLYYGDNLDILRQHVPDESVDLVYLDPPFNSNASYNVLFRGFDLPPRRPMYQAAERVRPSEGEQGTMDGLERG